MVTSAEDIVIKQKLYSYLVRQSDRDPSRLVLTFHDGEAKHFIIPDFGTEEHSKRLIKDRLEDTSNEVEHFLASFGCQFPVLPSSYSLQCLSGRSEGLRILEAQSVAPSVQLSGIRIRWLNTWLITRSSFAPHVTST